MTNFPMDTADRGGGGALTRWLYHQTSAVSSILILPLECQHVQQHNWQQRIDNIESVSYLMRTYIL